MRIRSVEVIPYALPFKAPYVTARGRLGRREMVLLRLRSEDGLTGLGEAVPLSLRGGVTLARVVAELELLNELSELDEASLGGGVANLSRPARCAALTALLDLRGRRAAAEGRSSDAPGAPVRCNATLVADEPAAVAEQALRWAAEGFTTFKLKLGAGGDDVGQARAVREALGPAASIRIDANAAWDVATAQRRLAALEELGIELAEQPVRSPVDSVAVAAATSIPIAGDESVESRADAERGAALGAFDLASVKLSKVGGPEEAIAIAEVLPSYLSSALDGPVGIAAAAQVAQTLAEGAQDAPNLLGDSDGDGTPGGGAELAHGLATQRLFASTVASVECELRDGLLHAPPGPGLGIELDERALDLHRL